MSKVTIAGIIIVLILGAAGAVMFLSSSDDTEINNSTADSSSQSDADSDASMEENENTEDKIKPDGDAMDSDKPADETLAQITYTDEGFSPSTLTVKVGSEITIINKSTRSLQFNSDDHPQHTDNGSLNVGSVAIGSSETFSITEAGTWGYHNHLKSSDEGTIIVE